MATSISFAFVVVVGLTFAANVSTSIVVSACSGTGAMSSLCSSGNDLMFEQSSATANLSTSVSTTLEG